MNTVVIKSRCLCVSSTCYSQILVYFVPIWDRWSFSPFPNHDWCTMAKSDFLSWDGDLDLEFLLGDFTEYSESDDLSDEYDEVETKRARKTSKTKPQPQNPQKACYECPVCNKSLKTIAGFRGHTTKQHGRFNLKASEHRSNGSKDIDFQKSASTISQSGVLTDEDFKNIISKAYQSTLDNILCDFDESDEFNLTNLVNVARTSSAVSGFYTDLFEDIFLSSNCSTSTPSDREELFHQLHVKRTDSTLLETGYEHFKTVDSSFTSSEVQHFTQVLLLDLVGEICKEQTKLILKRTEDNTKHLTDNDQTVLFYISGFIIRALRKRYSRHGHSDKMQCCDAFISTNKCEEKAFLAKYRKMISLKDRGGLEMPTSNFYLLVRECETVTRSMVDTDRLRASSLLLSPLKEKILESFMVQHYAKFILSGVSEAISASVLEDIIRLFLTVRGHAVVRVERNKLCTKTKAENKKTSKRCSSLRQTLKDISTVTN
ncbi:uncharacterized protein [Argopecten irradians]|uniref:uncharacterized protein n=1 Tax=Argopecten irradians TaxID=31199 RepID=UPI00371E53BE